MHNALTIQVQKLRQKMIQTFVILAALTWVTSTLWKNFKMLYHLHPDFWFVELSEQIYHMKKFTKFEKRIADSGWVSWVFQNGYYNEDTSTK